MRLIDADALKEMTNAHGAKIAYVASFLFDIDNSPTVDAAPVKWLREKMNHADDNNDMEMTDVISWLIQTWRNEQEVQDG